MNKILICLPIALTLTLTAGISLAKSHEKSRHKSSGGAIMQPLLKTMDTNSDKKISQREFQSSIEKKIRAADKDGNRSLSQSEVKALVTADINERIKRMIARNKDPKHIENTTKSLMKNLDADGNGEISQKEIQDAMGRRFSSRDKNHDGFISSTDRKGHKKKHTKKHKKTHNKKSKHKSASQD